MTHTPTAELEAQAAMLKQILAESKTDITLRQLERRVRERSQVIRDHVLLVLEQVDEAYSRELWDGLPVSKMDVALNVSHVSKVLRGMEAEGLLVSRLVEAGTLPGQTGLRRYYHLTKSWDDRQECWVERVQ
jgi:DNA-binding PadR family transcriptional regulator